MGNVSKVLCFRVSEPESKPSLKGKNTGKAGNSKNSDDKVKLKAFSCVTPNREAFEIDLCPTKSYSQKPCIHDYTLYSVASSNQDFGNRRLRQSVSSQAQRIRPILCDQGHFKISSSTAAHSTEPGFNGKRNSQFVQESFHCQAPLSLPRWRPLLFLSGVRRGWKFGVLLEASKEADIRTGPICGSSNGSRTRVPARDHEHHAQRPEARKRSHWWNWLRQAFWLRTLKE